MTRSELVADRLRRLSAAVVGSRQLRFVLNYLHDISQNDRWYWQRPVISSYHPYHDH